ncbi:SAM-dependent methyltransferase [Actinomadura decatromicini]|uniref:SAM-dependent methyltransferase n=1 Tax=Actinomadura decatromicini TaxID=2604572 RepID=A0A5D3FA99_9ACTN|nr:SAM-dependent methyltransferase [Actinomadura decatromicini]TYK45133.1 SAM-dependent methyltransferase [Actinomadura decatromicini]
MPDATPPPGVDTTRPSPARLYDWALGGRDNYQVDREAGAAALAVVPGLRETAVYNRAWLKRVVRYMCEQGIRQFIDIGSGLPTAENVHQVAQRHHPDARVVYVDNDPSVHVHARALLDDTDQAGQTAFVLADVRAPNTIMATAEVDRLIDLSQPVGLIIAAVLHFVGGNDDPADLVARLTGPLSPGGYVAISHATTEGASPEALAAVDAVFRNASEYQYVRSRDEIERILNAVPRGLMMDPGLVPVHEWRPDERVPEPPMALLGAVLRL